MSFVERKRGWFNKIGIGVLLVLVGILIGLVGIAALVVLNKPTPEELEALRLQDTITLITSEQTRIGFDCGEIGSEMHDFLETEIRPFLNARQPGMGWSMNVSEEMRGRIGKMMDLYFACGRLYRVAQTGNWGGLDDIGFSIELDKEVILVDTLIGYGGYGGPGEACDAICLDGKFQLLEGAVNQIEDRLSRQSP